VVGHSSLTNVINNATQNTTLINVITNGATNALVDTGISPTNTVTGGFGFYNVGADGARQVFSTNSNVPWQINTTAQFKRIGGKQGTTHVTGDYVLSAGWGTGPTLNIAGNTDTRGVIAVTAGTSTAADPTVTLTFKDGSYPAGTITSTVCSRAEVNGPTTGYWAVTSSTLTQAVFTFKGTPLAGIQYILTYLVFG